MPGGHSTPSDALEGARLDSASANHPHDPSYSLSSEAPKERRVSEGERTAVVGHLGVAAVIRTAGSGVAVSDVVGIALYVVP